MTPTQKVIFRKGKWQRCVFIASKILFRLASIEKYKNLSIVISNLFWTEEKNEKKTENVAVNLLGLGLFKGEDFKGPPIEMLIEIILKKFYELEPRSDAEMSFIRLAQSILDFCHYRGGVSISAHKLVSISS